jgi:acetyl esterase/lipase
MTNRSLLACRAAGLAVVLMLAVVRDGKGADMPKPELLWPGGAPGAHGDKLADKPSFTVWQPKADAANGAAVVVCPGGGYGGLATDHEGKQIGQWLNSFGVTAFVLEYRHRGRGYGHPAPLDDAQHMIRTVRARAGEWKVDPHRVGILGFSAGGHLASTAATHFDAGDPKAEDPIAHFSSRPDFAVLCYAVIAFGEPYTHYGSQHNLLGKDASPELVRSLSNEKQVTKETPPTFLFSTDEDRAVPPENSVQFYLALRKAGVPAELHVFRKGQHGVGLAKGVAGTSEWPGLCEAWMRAEGFLKKM